MQTGMPRSDSASRREQPTRALRPFPYSKSTGTPKENVYKIGKLQYNAGRMDSHMITYFERKQRTMKKTIALILVLVLGLVIFSSCSKEEAKEETAKMTITIVNKTGETAKNIVLKERAGSKKQSWDTPELANDEEVALTIDTVLDQGAPNLEFSYALENGNSVNTSIIMKGDQTVTLKVGEDGGAEAEIVTK